MLELYEPQVEDLWFKEKMMGDEHDHFGAWSFIFGFVIMMILDCIQF